MGTCIENKQKEFPNCVCVSGGGGGGARLPCLSLSGIFEMNILIFLIAYNYIFSLLCALVLLNMLCKTCNSCSTPGHMVNQKSQASHDR